MQGITLHFTADPIENVSTERLSSIVSNFLSDSTIECCNAASNVQGYIKIDKNISAEDAATPHADCVTLFSASEKKYYLED